ncbi:MAG: HAD-IC family P-type ATPase [Candidatus Riflebacteria bacterium]|nr:HAD-IC family P-type ATPase [Candidatus Riflebacteria bacterium]
MKEKKWFSLSVEQVIKELETNPEKGISNGEAEKRIENFGQNVLTPAKRVPAWRRFLGQFENPLIIILLVSAVASFFAGRATDAATIIAVTIVNAIIGFIQEQKAQGAIDALAKMIKTEAMVTRHSEKPFRIGAEMLVPGDVVQLSTGDRVPADLRLIQTRNFNVNESALTGESMPVLKNTDPNDSEASIGDRKCMAFSGSLVTAGSAVGVVVETGDVSEVGKINALMNKTGDLSTPLMERLEAFSKVFGIWVVAFGILIFIVGMHHGGNATEMFMAAVAAAVGAIPEGLPAVMTIVLAIGVKNMAARKAIIRKLPAVETLGSVTVICSDKTGTLTANEMTVQRMVTGSTIYNVEGVGFNPCGGKVYSQSSNNPLSEPDFKMLLKSGVLCNDSHLVFRSNTFEVEGDPTEGALITVAEKSGVVTDEMRKNNARIDVMPFDSAKQMMFTLNRDESGNVFIWAKGSVEKLLPMCSMQLSNGQKVPVNSDYFHKHVDDLAGQGMRVLGFAFTSLPAGTILIPESMPDMTFLGLQAMIDPPRPEVREALAHCRSAGIEVKMITGDHLATAVAIAKDLGIGHAGVAGISGKELSEMSHKEMMEKAELSSVFARVAPEHKYKLVEALQDRGHLVAMTGDGVNDAPALKRADIGVAMGISGTEVAKEAAAMILVDDNFATLVRAVEEGRNVFNNLVKSMVYILPTNTGQGLVILFATLIGSKLPITPVQVLWVNLLTAFLSLPLAFEAMEKGLMDKKPRQPEQPLIDRSLVVRIIVVSLLMTVACFVVYWYQFSIMGYDIEVARTSVVTAMVAIELFYLFPARGLHAPMPGCSPKLNKVFWPCIIVTVLLQLAFTYTGFFQKFMESRPMDLDTWLVILAISAVIIPLIESLKRMERMDSHEEK